jgi:hypothetical protein
MSILIGHAVMDENGSIDKTGQALVGDQTGKEICTRKFYIRTGGWNWYFRPKNLSLGKKAAQICREICDNPKFGYSQLRRWTGLDGYRTGNGGSFDCPSLVQSCYILAGADKLKKDVYSGNMAKKLRASGYFKEFTDKEHLETDSFAVPGSIWIGRNGNSGHAIMALEIGSGKTDIEVSKPYVEVVGRSVNVRQYPGKEYPKIVTVHKGEKMIYLETDEDSGWFWVETSKGVGCISNNKRYTTLVI